MNIYICTSEIFKNCVKCAVYKVSDVQSIFMYILFLSISLIYFIFDLAHFLLQLEDFSELDLGVV